MTKQQLIEQRDGLVSWMHKLSETIKRGEKPSLHMGCEPHGIFIMDTISTGSDIAGFDWCYLPSNQMLKSILSRIDEELAHFIMDAYAKEADRLNAEIEAAEDA